MENINKRILFIFILSVLMAFGCSTSDESLDSEYASGYPKNDPQNNVPVKNTPVSKTKRPSAQSAPGQRFNVQADTVTVQTRKKDKSPQAPVTVRNAVPQKYYSVQIGAYRLKSNTDRNYTLSITRFKKPVIRFYDSAIKMERICVGHFPSIDKAFSFLNEIQNKFPNDYKEAWVAGLTK